MIVHENYHRNDDDGDDSDNDNDNDKDSDDDIMIIRTIIIIPMIKVIIVIIMMMMMMTIIIIGFHRNQICINYVTSEVECQVFKFYSNLNYSSSKLQENSIYM